MESQTNSSSKGLILRLLSNYKGFISLNILCTIISSALNIITVPALLPFLDILFNNSALKNNSGKNNLIDSARIYFSDLVASQGKESAIFYLSISLIVLFFFKTLFTYFAMYFIAPVRFGVVKDLRKMLFKKSLRLPFSYFNEEKKGDIMSRSMNDVMEVEWGILNVLVSIFREPFVIIAALIMMLHFSTYLVLVSMILFPFTALFINIIGKSLRRNSAKAQEALGQVVSHLEEALGGLKIIKGFNASTYITEKFDESNNEHASRLIRAHKSRDASSPMNEFLGITTVALLLFLGAKEVFAGKMEGSTLIGFLYAFFMMIKPARDLTDAYATIQRGRASLDRIQNILNAEEEPEDKSNAISKKTLDKNITLSNVSFQYKPNFPYVLKKVNLEIPVGKTVAFVGLSGAGKSTLIDLIPRFRDSTEGEIKMDGINILEIKILDLRSMMGLVPQEAILFNDTIENNIIFGRENISESQVISALKIANALEFVENLPEGIKTNIGDRGGKLSGGQRQRITIARAVLTDPAILLLDEATSALDSESEKLVQDALDKIREGRTVLVVAHRLSTIKDADLIVVMENGEIIEQGTHDTLMSLSSAYKNFVALQGL
jgi:ABC-type multidrug transport system fused ATPase/permease subunit